MTKAFVPKPFVVYVTIRPNARNGVTEPFVSRVGPAVSIEEARQMIADDLKNMKDTMDGLFDPVSTKGRSYQIFRAEWAEVAVTEPA